MTTRTAARAMGMALTTIAVLVLAGPVASAGSASAIALKAPGSIVAGKPFALKVSGHVKGPKGGDLYVFFSTHKTCQSDALVEEEEATPLYEGKKVGPGKFGLKKKLRGKAVGKARFCAYLYRGEGQKTGTALAVAHRKIRFVAAKRSSLRLRAPHTVATGSSFTLKSSGAVKGSKPGDLYVFFSTHQTCQSDALVEEEEATPLYDGKKVGPGVFALKKKKLHGDAPGKARFCGYLYRNEGQKTGKTLARAVRTITVE